MEEAFLSCEYVDTISDQRKTSGNEKKKTTEEYYHHFIEWEHDKYDEPNVLCKLWLAKSGIHPANAFVTTVENVMDFIESKNDHFEKKLTCFDTWLGTVYMQDQWPVDIETLRKNLFKGLHAKQKILDQRKKAKADIIRDYTSTSPPLRIKGSFPLPILQEKRIPFSEVLPKVELDGNKVPRVKSYTVQYDEENNATKFDSFASYPPSQTLPENPIPFSEVPIYDEEQTIATEENQKKVEPTTTCDDTIMGI